MSQEMTRLSSARESFELRDGEAHVWAVSLDPDENRLQGLEDVLSSDERERAGRFAISLHRNRFVAARGVLRTILAGYSGVEPAEIRFSYGSHGKPLLPAAAGRDELHFNVSHTGDRALIAVTEGREIGVDIESIDKRPFDAEVVRRFFSPREGAVLSSAPEAARAGLFVVFWARKEACIKASGLGLSFPLTSLDVSVDAREPRVIVSGGDAAPGARSWTLVDVETVPACAAACAVGGVVLNVIRREFRF
jgi:4'-phosphopantetheinyl transferase